MQFSLRQPLILYLGSALFAGLIVIDVELAAGVLGCGLVGAATWSAYLWYSRSELRTHRWKAPWLLGGMAAGAASILYRLDIAGWRWVPGPYKIGWILQMTLVVGSAGFAILACFVATPLRAWIPARESKPGTRTWIRRLSYTALWFGPIFFAAAWLAIISGLLELVLSPFVRPNSWDGLGLLLLLVFLATGFQIVALICFVASLIMQMVSDCWTKWTNTVNSLYCLAWLVYGVYDSHF